MILYSALACQL